MDISCVFVVSKYGDVLLSKDYIYDGILGQLAYNFRQRILNELDCESDEEESRLPDHQPYFSHGDVTAYFVSRNDIYLVCCCLSRLGRAPILALDFLSSLFQLLCSFCRLPPENLDAKAIIKHQILVLEVLDEVVAKGQVQVTSYDKIKNLIYSPPPAAATTTLELVTSAPGSVQKLAKLLPNVSSLATPIRIGSPEVTKIFDPGLLSTAYSVIPSALRQAVSSLAASALHASSDGDVFVDVVERVSLKFDAGGTIEHYRLDGQLVVEARFKDSLLRSGGGECPNVKLFLAENIVMEVKEADSCSSINSVAKDGAATSRGFTGSTTVLSKCVFHPRCRLGKKGTEAKPEMIIDFPNVEKIVALTYEVNRESMKSPPPLHVDLSVGPSTSSSSTSALCSADISIVLTSRMPPITKAATIKVTLPIPDYIEQATRLASNLPYIQGVEQSLDFDRRNTRIVWTIRHLPGKGCVELKTRLSWHSSNDCSKNLFENRYEGNGSHLTSSSGATSAADAAAASVSVASIAAPAAPSYNLDVGPAFLEFELSGFSQSGFRIEALKFVDSTFASTAKMKKDTQNMNRWLRYITLDGKVYSFVAT